MESRPRCRIEDSVENIGAIVDFEEDQGESDPDTNDLVNSINNFINLNTDPEELCLPKLAHSNSKTITPNVGYDNLHDNIVEFNKDKLDSLKSFGNQCQNELFNDLIQYSIETKGDEPKETQDSFYCNIHTSDKEATKDIPVSGENNKSDKDFVKPDCYGFYENVQQSLNEENEYEEINFDNTMLFKMKDNYVDFSLIPHKDGKNILDGIGLRKEAQVSRRRWSMTTEDVSKTQKTGARRWSLKNGITIKPILKQQNTPKDKNLQSVNFRQKGNSLYTILESAIKYILAKVKTFREANSSVYEPVDVVDYVMVKGKIQCQSYMIKSYFHRIRSE